MTKHIQRGHQRKFVVLTIASGAKQPTVAEMAGATEVRTVPGGIDGFEAEVDRADASDSSSTFDKTVRGTKKADSSALTVHKDSVDHTLLTLLAEGLSCFIVFSDNEAGALEAGDKVDVWPSEVLIANTLRNRDKDTNAFKVSFAHPDEPVFEVAVLA